MELNLNNLFSYDSKKIVIDSNFVTKKTNQIECDNLTSLQKNLSAYTLLIDNKHYALKVPKVYDYNDGIIKMEFFNGKNLELLLRNPKTHEYAIKILNYLLLFVINNKIGWTEFAPRNILINDTEICFVDFEKPFIDTNYILFLRNHVFEEYASFIFENERIFSTSQIYSLQKNEENYSLNVSDIQIKRIKYLAKFYYNRDIISYQEYLFLYKLIIDAETPYISEKNEYLFPRLYLSSFLINKENDESVYENYANYILYNNEKKRKLK